MLAKIKELREQTAVSFTECKKAIEEAGGSLEKALAILKKASFAVADKKSERATGAGVIEAYIHSNGKVGALVDLRCETDFVAKTAEFKELAHNIALHIAALKPKFVSRDDIPEEAKKELEYSLAKEIENANKPENIKKKIIEGKMESVFKEEALMEQPFVKNPDIQISSLIKESIQKLGENIKIARFARFEI